MAFYRLKKNKKWIFKAVDRSTRRTVAYVIGDRNIATFRRLYNKVKHNKNCKYFTDNWNGFSAILPKKRHIIGKKHTILIEQNNSNTRHYLGRMTRRTKIVSHSIEMLNATLKLWISLCEFGNYELFRNTCSTIFN